MALQELAGSPKEALSESSGSTATRLFLVPWNERLAVAQNLVSNAYPNFPQCRINSISIQPWVDELAPLLGVVVPAINTNTYGTQPALISVAYGPDFTKKVWPTDLTKPDIRYGTELRFRVGSSAQFLLIPTTGLKWEIPGGGGTTPVTTEDQNNRILIPIRELELQWDFVDNVPMDRLDGLMGKSNDDDFLGAPAETVLFESYSVEESFRAAPANPHTNRVTVNVRIRKIKSGANTYGWNHDYSKAHGWAKMLFEDDEPRYKLEDMSGAFL